jgi:flavin reductase (DIM6/NTAB) family NADH-FMN oxidoreductase RutF
MYNQHVMPIEPESYRRVLRRRAASVMIVTMRVGEQRHGLTVMDFCSVSLEPPLVLISIGNDLRSHQLLQQARAFAVNLLDENQQELSDRFAGRFPEVTERLAGLRYHEALTGAPILDDALGWLDCRVVNIVPGGDHTIYLGQVEAGDLLREGRPLLYYNGDYTGLTG